MSDSTGGNGNTSPELLNAFDPAGRWVKVEERKRLLAEIRESSYRTGDAPLAVESVYLVLCNSAGQLHLVRRGDKPENPNRWDKTVGGHVAAGESHDATLCREAVEEIGVTVILTDVLSSPREVKRLNTAQFAVVRPVDFVPWLRSERAVATGAPWVKRHRSVIYVGCYDGPVIFPDGEAVDHRLIGIDELRRALRDQPEIFTYDLNLIVENYRAFLR